MAARDSMEHVVVLWSVAAAAALVLAVLCGLMWLGERREPANLMLCLLGIATAFSAYIELAMMHSITPDEYGTWLRWYHLPIFLALIAQVLFVRYYLEADMPWLLGSFIAARTFVVIVNFGVNPNYNFASIDALRSVTLLGDPVAAIASAVPRRELQWIAVASLLVLIAYAMTASVRGWLRGGPDCRRRARAVGLAFGLPMLCAVIYTQLLIYGVLRGPVSNIPWFLGSLSMMAYVSGRDFLLSRRARLEVAELRSQLAQIERVNLLGQLASSMAHELSQPLSAISLNVGAGQRLAKRAAPDIAELSAILDDIAFNGRRVVDISDRMRQLFRRRPIALSPIKIEDVLRSAVSLLGTEASAKRVVVRWQVEPGLPLVSGDSVHLTQVLLNLIMNGIQAVQSRPVGGRFITVKAQPGTAGNEVEISVQDSGPGVLSTIVDRIFEPFFSTKPEGMGVGLALSHTIVEAHGGRLWVDREVEQEGAVFRFTLQRASTGLQSVPS